MPPDEVTLDLAGVDEFSAVCQSLLHVCPQPGQRRVKAERGSVRWRYLISFDEGAMTVPEEDLSEVDGAAHSVVGEAKDAGVWVFGRPVQR
jgi:hypothetical protein